MSFQNLKNTLYSSVSTYFEFFAGLVVSVLIARSLGPSEYGIYSYLVKIAGISIILTNAGIGLGAIKFIAEARTNNGLNNIHAIYAYFNKIQYIKILLIVTCIIILNWLYPGIIIDEGSDENLLLLLLAVVTFKSAYMFRVGVLKGFENFRFLAFVVLIVSPLNVIFVSLGMYRDIGVEGFFMIFLITSFAYLCLSVFFVNKHWSEKRDNSLTLDAEIKKRIDKHLKIVTVNTIIGTVVAGELQIVILKLFSSNEEIAFYNVAMVLSKAALALLPGVYSQVLLPVIAKSYATSSDNTSDRINQSIRYLFTLGVMVSTPCMIYSEQIVSILYGQDYSDVGFIFSIFIISGVIPIALRDPVNSLLLSMDKQGLLLKFNIYTLFISLGINYYSIYKWGLIGGVISFSLVSIFLSIVLIFVANRLVKISPNIKKMLLVLFAAFTASAISIFISSFLEDVWKAVVGFLVFGFLNIYFLIFFNALEDFDYVTITKLSKKGGGVIEKILARIINARLNI